jgi:hypothetical protein
VSREVLNPLMCHSGSISVYLCTAMSMHALEGDADLVEDKEERRLRPPA